LIWVRIRSIRSLNPLTASLPATKPPTHLDGQPFSRTRLKNGCCLVRDEAATVFAPRYHPAWPAALAPSFRRRPGSSPAIGCPAGLPEQASRGGKLGTGKLMSQFPNLPIYQLTNLPTYQPRSPVGSGANFGGLPPRGASSHGPSSLAASPRLLLSVTAFRVRKLFNLTLPRGPNLREFCRRFSPPP